MRSRRSAGLIGAIGGGVVAILAPADVRRPAGVDRSDLSARSWSWPGWSSRSASASRSAAPRRGLARALGHRAAGRGRPDAGAGVRRRPGPADRVAGRRPSRRGPVPRLAETAADVDGRPHPRTCSCRRRPRSRPASAAGWTRPACPTCSSASSRCPRPPVDRPDDPRRAGDRGRRRGQHASRSRRRRCGLSSVGTGFVVSPSYVVTNAHVVAGQRRGVRVADGRRPVCSTPCRCCSTPTLDIALLHVDGPAASPRCGSPPGPEPGRPRRDARLSRAAAG